MQLNTPCRVIYIQVSGEPSGHINNYYYSSLVVLTLQLELVLFNQTISLDHQDNVAVFRTL